MKTRDRTTLLVSGIVLVILAAAHLWLHQAAMAERRPRLVRQNFQPDKFAPHQVVRPFPPIIDPPHVAADQVGRRLQPNELVLGIELDGLTRAYPINMLTGPSREIFNDTLGQHAIAATW